MTEITWTCDACQGAIPGDTCRLHIQEWRTHPGADNPDTWHAHHAACVPADALDEDRYVLGYCIDTGQVATREQLTWWTDHLAGKNWYDAGGWREMVLRATGVDVAGDAARARIWSVDGDRPDAATTVSETTGGAS